MNYCPKCGFEVFEGANYCSMCGEKLDFTPNDNFLSINEIEVKFCSQCGEENFSDVEACAYCGVVFSGNEGITRKSILETTLDIKDKNAGGKEKIDRPRAVRQLKKPIEQKQEKVKRKTVNIQDQKSRVEHWKIMAFVGILIVIGIIIIYSTNGFNGSTSIQTQSNIPGQSSQIDLSLFTEINNLEKALEKNPDNLDMILRLANITHDAGLFQKSIGYYDRYLQKNPSNTDARVDMGVCYFELKDYNQAEKIFLQAVKQSPNHQIVHLNLGVLYLTKGEIENAKDWLKKCVALGEHTDVGRRAAELLKSH